MLNHSPFDQFEVYVVVFVQQIVQLDFEQQKKNDSKSFHPFRVKLRTTYRDNIDDDSVLDGNGKIMKVEM